MSERMWLDEQLEKARTERDEAIRQSQEYLKTARDCLDKQTAKDAEIARLREALQFVRPTIELQAKESPPGSSDRAALAVVDAALKRGQVAEESGE